MDHSFRRLLAVLCLLVACSSEEVTPPEGPHALYSQDAASLDNPFPDARLFAEGGGLDLARRPGYYRPFVLASSMPNARRLFEGYAEAFLELPGFGRFAPVLVRFSDRIDAATLQADGAPRFVYLQQDAAGAWVRGPRAVVELPEDAAFEAEGRHFAFVHPEAPLASDRPASLVLLAGVRASDGRPLVQAPDFFRLARGEGGAALSALAAACGVGAGDLLLSVPLLPKVGAEELTSVAAWLAGQPAPRIEIPSAQTLNPPAGVFSAAAGDNITALFSSWNYPGNNQSFEHVGYVVAGTWAARDFRGTVGHWTREMVASPETAPEKMLDFVLTLPVGPKPPGGYQVVIGAHGIFGRNSLNGAKESFCLRFAETLGARGLGCLGIDAADHGNRGGMLDFFSVTDPRRTRDDFRQTAADFVQLLSMARAFDLDADGTPDLDPDVGFLGNSLGGIMGTSFVSLDERVDRAVLNVTGAGLYYLLDTPFMRFPVGIVLMAETNLTEVNGIYPLFQAVAQLVFEPGEPLHYAARLAGRRVLVQEGIGDRTVPNVATRALQSVSGLPTIAGPRSEAGGFGGVVRIDPAALGVTDPDFNPHDMIWQLAPVRSQAVGYLLSGGTTLE